MFGSSMGMPVFWLAMMILLLVVEALVPGLISIWFALGALAALISALFGAPVWLQVVWFIVVSVVSLVLTRPLARRYVNGSAVATNADMLIGKECVVTEEIDNVHGKGAVSVGGKEWTARMTQDGQTAAVGEVLRVQRIEGVKLIVQKDK